MAETKSLAAAVRAGSGKGAARRVRREGRVPAVIYGGGEPPEPISLSYHDINKLIYAGGFLTSTFELDVDGRKERVIPRDFQLDPVRDKPLHVDFLRLTAGQRITVEVPVHFVGQENAPGIKEGGGTLNIVRHTVEMSVPADAIPTGIEADVSKLSIGDTVPVSDIRLPLRARLTITDRDFMIASIAPPTVEPEVGEPTAEAEATAAPGAGSVGGASDDKQ